MTGNMGDPRLGPHAFGNVIVGGNPAAPIRRAIMDCYHPPVFEVRRDVLDVSPRQPGAKEGEIVIDVVGEIAGGFPQLQQPAHRTAGLHLLS